MFLGNFLEELFSGLSVDLRILKEQNPSVTHKGYNGEVQFTSPEYTRHLFEVISTINKRLQRAHGTSVTFIFWLIGVSIFLGVSWWNIRKLRSQSRELQNQTLDFQDKLEEKENTSNISKLGKIFSKFSAQGTPQSTFPDDIIWGRRPLWWYGLYITTPSPTALHPLHCTSCSCLPIFLDLVVYREPVYLDLVVLDAHYKLQHQLSSQWRSYN